MKIAFFGSYDSFGYFKIGGTESFTRRLATTLIAKGHQADFLVYGAQNSESQKTSSGICLHAFVTLQEALDFLKKNYQQVISIYLPLRDRLRYLLFRQQCGPGLTFHHVFFSWPDSILKRQAGFLDARLYPFNGRLICISPRQYAHVRQWSDRAFFLLPPVGEEYFFDCKDKPLHKKIHVTYIGRTESAKGIDKVITLFQELQLTDFVHCEIHGFHHKTLAASVKTHEWLKKQQGINYYYTPFKGYSKELEENLIYILRNTDILLLPYLKLSSTIDMPMLLLEGMASLCAVITPPVGSIPEIYGSSPFLHHGTQEIADIIKWVCESPARLQEERQRIFQRNCELSFRAGQVTNRLLEAIS